MAHLFNSQTLASNISRARLWSGTACLLVVSIGAVTACAQGGEPEQLPAYLEPAQQTPVMIDSGETLEPIPAPLTDDLHLNCEAPPTIESSGTWLRRGLWYADLEAIVMSRTANRHDTLFAQEFTVNNPFGVPINQRYAIGESSPGAEGQARLTLGRFLFRDYKNRDHNAEMVVSGGGEWNEEFEIQAINNNQLVTGPSISAQGRALSFSGADEMDLIYSSRLSNFEWNYSVTDRMRRDRMELQPSGEWIRRADSGVTQEFLAGLRFVDLEENIDWNARDIQNPFGGITNGEGALYTRARNNLFGVQLGYGVSYQSDRWNLSLGTKQGFLITDARVTRDFSITGFTGDDPSFSHNGHENRLSYLIQVSLLSRYHLRPNLSLRFGWEMMYITNVALAPSQLSFVPSEIPIAATGDPVYHGFTFGTEYYW